MVGNVFLDGSVDIKQEKDRTQIRGVNMIIILSTKRKESETKRIREIEKKEKLREKRIKDITIIIKVDM